MGVYHEVSVAYGIRLGPENFGGDDFYEWAEDNIPPGYTIEWGGDMMGDENVAVVYAKKENVLELFSTMTYEAGGFGVFEIDNLLNVTGVDMAETENLARELNGKAGYFVITSVG